MVTKYHVKVLDPTNDDSRDFIAARLGEFNQPYVGKDEPVKVILGVDNDLGERIAGLSAVIYYKVMSIDLLWVHDEVRGQGIGKHLIEQAERIARHSGCGMMHLDTFDFQAPKFYEKLGFERWGALGPYPHGHQRFFYRKLLKGKPGSSAWGYKEAIYSKE